MSMPMLALSPMEPADRPVMRMVHHEVDVAPEPAAGAAATPNEVPPSVTPKVAASNATASGEADVSAPPPRASLRDGRVFAEDGATLPAACVVCGDSVDLIGLPTLRGGVRFSLCHEHVVSAAARAVAGVAVLAVLGYLLAQGVGSRFSTLAISAALLSAAAGLIASAVPVWTWHRKGCGRRLFRVGSNVREEIGRTAG